MVWAVAVLGVLAGFLTNDPHVRTDVRELRALVQEGVERSATFASLVKRLDESDVVVYVQYGYAVTHQIAGSIAFISSAGGRRYVRVTLEWDLPRQYQLSILGHELRHAVEIADAAEVVDAGSFERLYARIGRATAQLNRCFDTSAAIQSGTQVFKELRSIRPG